MDSIEPWRFVFAFLFVLALIGLMGYGLRRFSGKHTLFALNQEAGRIKIIEVRYLDPKRKLLLIRRDDKEHLILLADGRETVVEAGIVKRDEQNPDDPMIGNKGIKQ